MSKVDSVEKRTFYLNEAAENAWNSRELERQIKSLSFERTLKPDSNKEELSIHSVLKDPYIFEFLGLSNDTKNTEFQIESAIIEHIQKFLLEFGKGFAFVARRSAKHRQEQAHIANQCRHLEYWQHDQPSLGYP